MFKTLKDFNFQNKRVLVRCDFNVPMKNGEILDDFKIKTALLTITHLKRVGAKVILMSHLGRPLQIKNKRKRLKKFTLKSVRQRLEHLLKEKVRFSKDITGKRVRKEIEKMKPGNILLLENLRFEKGEQENSTSFAKSLAELGEVYVNDAFPSCHRNHVSIAGLPKLLPHFAGANLEKEIEVLSRISQNPEPPLVVIIGGVKIASKIKVIEKFLKDADHLIFGGKIANIILRVKGICPGKPWPAEEIVKKIERLNLTDPKIHLPVDVVVSPDELGETYIRETGPGNVRKEESIFDVGEETIQAFGEIIKGAQTVFWSGTLGLVENENFSKGTKEIAQLIVRNHGAFKVVGGGDTIAFLRKINLLDRFSFVSTGGGAMLSFLAGEKLPGIEALK